MSARAESPIDLALTALRGLDAAAIADEIEAAWRRAPLTAGIAGSNEARAALFAHVCDGLLDATPRQAGSAALRVRRGAVTRFHARRDDGDESETLPAAELTPPDGSVAFAAVAARELELAHREAEVPALVRNAPPRWKLWLWPIRWVQTLLARSQVAAWRRALVELDGARAAVRQLADTAGAKTARSRAEHEHFVERLRIAAAAGWVREVEVELAAAPVPDGVELLELTGWSRAGAAVDGVLEIAPDAIAPTLAALPSILRGARALRLLRRAHHAVELACDALDREIAAAEIDFTRRMSSIAKLQIAEPGAFATAQLDRVRPQVIASMGAVIEHASLHLHTELAELGAGWRRAVEAATTSHELSAAVASIEEGTAASGQRIADEVRILATGGLGGLVHDMTPIVLAPLTAHGLTEAELRPRTTAALPPMAILPSLTHVTPGGLATGRLSAMFRSTETVKQDVLDKLADRASRMRNKASAEMLDAEPLLRAAVETALAGALQGAIEAVTNRLDDQLAAARTEIAAARTALAPKGAARDAGRAHAKALAAAIAALEANAPAAEAAAAAV